MPKIAYLRNLLCSIWVNRPGPVQLTIAGDMAGVALLGFTNPHWESFPDDPGGPRYVMEADSRLILQPGAEVLEVKKAGFVFVLPVLPLSYRPRPAPRNGETEASFLVGWGYDAAGAAHRFEVELTFLQDRKKTHDNVLLTDEWFTVDRSLLPATHFLDINRTFAPLIEQQGFTAVRLALCEGAAALRSGKDPVAILGSDKEGMPLAILDRAHRKDVQIRLEEGLTLAAILANTAEDRRLLQFDNALLPAAVSLVF